MQQLETQAFFLPVSSDDELEVEIKAEALAATLSLPLQERGRGADVWFAVLPHPQGAIHLHYDFHACCFWLTATGGLAQDQDTWSNLQQTLLTAYL